jgi:hypothetical protein
MNENKKLPAQKAGGRYKGARTEGHVSCYGNRSESIPGSGGDLKFIGCFERIGE